MKRKTNFLLATLLIACSATAQTNVSGFINANTTWNLAGSPYIIVGNALLSHGYTLTIDPGVVVKFDTMKTLQIDGELHAVGTATNRIIFTSNKAIPDTGDWGKIQFSDTCVDAVFDAQGNYLSGCIMKYCDVNYAGGIGYGAVEIESSSVFISNCNVYLSRTDGIYCHGFVKLDSSSIRNCSGYGMRLLAFIPSYCPYAIQNDTFEFNLAGGIQSGGFGSSLCSSSYIFINHNYFNSNGNPGFSTTSYGALSFNSCGPFVISENYFVNNSAQSDGGAITLNACGATTIQCNRFFGNHSYYPSTIEIQDGGNDTIGHNIFDGNICTFNHPNACVISEYKQAGIAVVINDNLIINNITPGGGTLHLRGQATTDYITTYFVHNNEFNNNSGLSNIYLLIQLCDFSLQFAHINNNNFLNSNAQYEIDNHGVFGGPNMDATNNYWGTTNTLHIDSVIDDYFDDGNRSVVFYSPILTSPAAIDTTCPVVINGINNIEATNSNSTLFPNPFSKQATIKFPSELYSATFHLYNLFGQLVQEKNNISGGEIILSRENLGSGVYIYEVMEKGNKIYSGKAVVY